MLSPMPPAKGRWRSSSHQTRVSPSTLHPQLSRRKWERRIHTRLWTCLRGTRQSTHLRTERRAKRCAGGASARLGVRGGECPFGSPRCQHRRRVQHLPEKRSSRTLLSSFLLRTWRLLWHCWDSVLPRCDLPGSPCPSRASRAPPVSRIIGQRPTLHALLFDLFSPSADYFVVSQVHIISSFAF